MAMGFDPTQVLAWAAVLACGGTLWALGGLHRAGEAFRLSRRQGYDAGPTPGYAIYPAEALEVEPLGLPSWFEPTALEAFHGPVRRRLVLTGRMPRGTFEARGVAVALRQVCERLASVGGVDVVALELSERPEGPSTASDWLAIYCPDRRGWSGAEPSPSFVLLVPGVSGAGGAGSTMDGEG